MTFEEAREYFRKRTFGQEYDPACNAAQTLSVLPILHEMNEAMGQAPLNLPDPATTTDDEFMHWITIEVGRCIDRIKQRLNPE